MSDMIRKSDALAIVQEWTYCCDAEEAIAALPAVVLGVKPLVWEGDGHWHAGDNEGWLEEATTPFGWGYAIEFGNLDNGPWVASSTFGETLTGFDDPDAAKAAAQADYEARILAALEPVAVGVIHEEQNTEQSKAFWNWLPLAYRDGHLGEEAKFTKYNMEVAHYAGWCAALTSNPVDASQPADPAVNAPAEDAVAKGETGGETLERLGMDGAKWAAEFRTTALRLGYSDMDEGWLIGWFCNAVMAGYDRSPAPDLADPVTVHANMLRGTIAKPTVEQIIHLYGREAFQPMIDAAIAKALEGACLAVSEHADWPEDEYGRTEQVGLFARVINAIRAIKPAVTQPALEHVNEPPKSEHDAGNVLTPDPAAIREAALREAATVAQGYHERALEWAKKVRGLERYIGETDSSRIAAAILALIPKKGAAE